MLYIQDECDDISLIRSLLSNEPLIIRELYQNPKTIYRSWNIVTCTNDSNLWKELDKTNQRIVINLAHNLKQL